MSSRRRRSRPDWIPRLTLRGAVFLIIGAGIFLNAVLIGRRDLLFVGGFLLLLPIIASCYVALRPINVQVSRSFRPPGVEAGSTTSVALTVRNLTPRPLDGLRWQESASEGLSVPDPALVPHLDRSTGSSRNPGSTTRLEYALTPAVRGVYDVGPLFLHSYDPFGLVYRQRAVGESHDLVVTPRVSALPGDGVSVAGGDGNARELLRHHNPHSDELIAREYRPGDPLRRVNWPATARHGEIMVRQEEQRNVPSARLILDTTAGGAPAFDTVEGGVWLARHDVAFETAIDLTASIGVHLLAAGFRVSVAELGPSQLAPSAESLSGGLRGDVPAVFVSPGGELQLVEGLASVVPVVRRRSADDGATGIRGEAAIGLGGVPTFAVLIAIDDDDVGDLAALRGGCEPAVAFVLPTVAARIVDRLGEAGWQCVPVRGVRDIPTAWESALRGRVIHGAG